MATQVIDNVLPKGFFRRSEVISVLGVSDATVERMARDERLRSKLMPVPGRKAERIFVAEDVEKLKAQKEKRRELRPPSVLASAKPRSMLLQGDTTLALTADAKQTVTDLVTSLVAALREPRGVPLESKLWLTWEEAAALSGIPKSYLRKAVVGGKIQGQRFGRSWRVWRASLEDYLPE